MALNASALIAVVDGMFDVIEALIANVIDLITGSLITLSFYGLLIGLVITIFIAIGRYIKNSTTNAINMKNK